MANIIKAEEQGLRELYTRLNTLAIFRELLGDPVISALMQLLGNALDNKDKDFARSCGEFCSLLYAKTDNFSDYLLEKTLSADNAYVRRLVRSLSAEDIIDIIEKRLFEELAVLSDLAAVKPQCFSAVGIMLPAWRTSVHDFKTLYLERLTNINKIGYGVFSSCHMFTVRASGDGVQLRPVMNFDAQQLDGLYGYELEREAVLDNTLAFLSGSPAVNVLLYGDAGTGKSATVKAIANRYHTEGLRLIEVRKSQFSLIPDLIDMLADNPLKFILFIDDLSFTANDNEFSELKAILEGGVTAQPRNILIYATSNRRHFLKESLADRSGDDIHRSDTIEETVSLSHRFGLTVTFAKPDKELYLHIVEYLALGGGLLPDKELFARAEIYALNNGGRSPRTARQFINYTLGD